MIWANGNNAAEKVTFLVTLRKLINKFYSLRGAITSVWHFEESLQTQSFVAVVRRFTDAEMFPSKTTLMLEDHWKVHEQLFALKNFKLNVWFRKRITRKPLNYSQLNRTSFRRSLRLISRWWLAREIIIADEPTNKISIYAYRISHTMTSSSQKLTKRVARRRLFMMEVFFCFSSVFESPKR